MRLVTRSELSTVSAFAARGCWRIVRRRVHGRHHKLSCLPVHPGHRVHAGRVQIEFFQRGANQLVSPLVSVDPMEPAHDRGVTAGRGFCHGGDFRRAQGQA